MRFALRAAYGGANWLVRKQTAVHTAKRTGNYLSFLLCLVDKNTAHTKSLNNAFYKVFSAFPRPQH